uniref:PCNA-associated factor histone-like domain-containing protein n=1 Tax=Amphimedon queenslandica TaxID=400682 RepID=A0A1X7V5I1_AMPQE
MLPYKVNGYAGSIKDIVYTSSTGIVLLIDQEIITLMNESTSIHSPSGLSSSILENNVFHITGRGRDIIYDNVRKKGKGVGGNPIRVHPTPAWQK